jgi:hypothetical protein
VLYEEQILCGIHRDRACRELEIEAAYVRPRINDPFEYAIGDNERRRGQLTELQRIETAEKMANLKHGAEPGGRGNQYVSGKTSNEALPNISIERAAKLNGVSRSAVDRFRRIKTNQTIPEVLAAVKAGEVALPRAAEYISPLPRDQQLAALEEAKTHTKRRSSDAPRRSAKPTDWKTTPAFLASEKRSLAQINIPSIYPVDIPLPVNEHYPHIQAKVQAAICELKNVELKIAKMTSAELHEDVYRHVQFLQTYGMEPDGIRITGPIDQRWIKWVKSVATKMQVRKMMLGEAAQYREAAKRARVEARRPNRKEKDEPVFELQWKKFQPKLKEALQLFHRDDQAEVIKRTTDFIQKHFAPRQ